MSDKGWSPDAVVKKGGCPLSLQKRVKLVRDISQLDMDGHGHCWVYLHARFVHIDLVRSQLTLLVKYPWLVRHCIRVIVT